METATATPDPLTQHMVDTATEWRAKAADALSLIRSGTMPVSFARGLAVVCVRALRAAREVEADPYHPKAKDHAEFMAFIGVL